MYCGWEYAGGTDYQAVNINPININYDEWNYFSWVYEADINIISFYLNENLVFTDSPPAPPGNTADGFFSMGSQDGNGDGLFGSLDNFQIWNTALTQSEIITYQQCPPTGNESGLVGYWTFEEGNGSSTINDLSGNNNNGIINNSPTFSEDVPNLDCSSENPNEIIMFGGENCNLIVTLTDLIVENPRCDNQAGLYSHECVSNRFKRKPSNS